MGCFSGSRLMRGCFAEAGPWEVMFGKSLSRTQQTVSGFCIGSPRNVSLVFTDLLLWLHREKLAKELVLFWLLLAASMDLCWFSSLEPRGFFWIEPPLLIPVWSLPTGLDCRYPDNKDWYHLKGLLLNRSISNPLVLLTILFPLPLVDGLEGRLKHLRTLIRVGFEKKSKPTPSLLHSITFLLKINLLARNCGTCL
jgi:hypothetical protein